MKTYDVDKEFQLLMQEFQLLMQKILPDLPMTITQYSEMRRAFACGAASMLMHMATVAAVLPEPEGIAELEKVSKHLEGFIKIRIGLDA